MNSNKTKDFMYFLFHRYAAGHEPTEQQYKNALVDFQKQQLPKRTTQISNSDKRHKPTNIVVK